MCCVSPSGKEDLQELGFTIGERNRVAAWQREATPPEAEGQAIGTREAGGGAAATAPHPETPVYGTGQGVGRFVKGAYRVLKQVHPKAGIDKDGIAAVQDALFAVLEQVLERVAQLVSEGVSEKWACVRAAVVDQSTADQRFGPYAQLKHATRAARDAGGAAISSVCFAMKMKAAAGLRVEDAEGLGAVDAEELRQAVEDVIQNELAKHSAQEFKKAVTKFGRAGQSVGGGACAPRAGLQFSVEQVAAVAQMVAPTTVLTYKARHSHPPRLVAGSLRGHAPLSAVHGAAVR